MWSVPLQITVFLSLALWSNSYVQGMTFLKIRGPFRKSATGKIFVEKTSAARASDPPGLLECLDLLAAGLLAHLEVLEHLGGRGVERNETLSKQTSVETPRQCLEALTSYDKLRSQRAPRGHSFTSSHASERRAQNPCVPRGTRRPPDFPANVWSDAILDPISEDARRGA